MEYLLSLMSKDNKMFYIMKNIKDIDKEHNGYVTCTELEDIIKLGYKEELQKKSLKALFKPFESI